MHIYSTPPPPFEFTIHQIQQSNASQYTYNGTWHDLPVTLTLSKENEENPIPARLNAKINNIYPTIEWINNIPKPTMATNTEHFLHLPLTANDAATIIHCTTADACTHAINNVMQRFIQPEQYTRYNTVRNVIQYLQQRYPFMQTNSIIDPPSTNIKKNHLICTKTHTILWHNIDEINHWCSNNILHIERDVWRRAMSILHTIQLTKYQNHPQMRACLPNTTHHVSQHEYIQYIRALQRYDAPSIPCT